MIRPPFDDSEQLIQLSVKAPGFDVLTSVTSGLFKWHSTIISVRELSNEPIVKRTISES